MAVPRPTSPQSLPSYSNPKQQQRRGRSTSGRRRPTTARRHSGSSTDSSRSSTSSSSTSKPYKNSFKKPSLPDHDKYLGLDCEMVGGISGESLCARAVLVDWKGAVVFDSYVKPSQPIADYRTFVSGIVESDLADAPPLAVVRAQVLELIRDKIVVGHALHNDFLCLQIHEHPWYDIRDTATYRPFLQMSPQYGCLVPRKLRDLALERLGKNIQSMGQAHCPAEDARAALDVYKTHRPRWESVVAFDLKKERQQYLRLQQQLYAQKHDASEQQFHEMWTWQQQQPQQAPPRAEDFPPLVRPVQS